MMSNVRDTSLETYFGEIQPTLGKRQKAVFDIIEKLGSSTNLEISRYSGIPINQVTPRTNELVKKGLVVADTKRECSVSHKTVYSWRVKI